MAITPTTLQTLINLLRARVDMKVNQFLTDADATSYLNNSLAILDGILISKFSDYKITPTILSVGAGTNIITLPNDFVKLRGVDVYYNVGNVDGYKEMFEYSWEHRNKKLYPVNGPSLVSPYVFEYRLQGNGIVIIPAAAAANYSYRVWYTPDYVPLVNPTDTLQTYMDTQAWHEYAIADSAVKVCAMQDLDPSTFQMQAAELKEHIMKLSAPNRNSGEPKQVTDSRGDFSGYPYGSFW